MIADAFIQSPLHCIQGVHFLGNEPMIWIWLVKSRQTLFIEHIMWLSLRYVMGIDEDFKHQIDQKQRYKHTFILKP